MNGSAKHDVLQHSVLDFAADAIRLLVRQPDGRLQIVGIAPVDVPDFGARIEALRTEHQANRETRDEVALRLPPEQIVLRDYHVGQGQGIEDRSAVQRLTNDTGYDVGDLLTAVSRKKAGSVQVQGALRQTADEATEYARRWGFLPGPIVSSVPFDQDLDGLPVLTVPPTQRAAASNHAPRVALAASAVGLAALIAVGATYFGSTFIADGASDPPRLAEPGPAVVPISVDRQASLDLIADDEPTQISPLGAAAQIGNGETVSTTKAPGIEAYPTLDLAVAPSVPSPPRTETELRVGSALHEIAPQTTDPLPVPAAIQAAPAVPKLAAAPMPESEARSDGSGQLVIAATGTSVTEPPAVEGQPEAVPAAPSEPQTSATDRAPAEMAIAPRPRPAQVPEPSTAEQTPSSALTALDAVKSISEQEAPSMLAVGEAPPPTARPERLAARYLAKTQPAQTKRIHQAGPLSIRQAADRDGLSLDRTSLLGVMQAQDGRKALVRTPGGEFRQVARGDMIDGWRVASIGRTAMRLTRQGQNRTLLLVGQ